MSVRMRQGMPTRVRVDGVRCRFGINTWRADDQQVHFSVLRDGEMSHLYVHRGDRVSVVDREWVVTELEVPESGNVMVQLDETTSQGDADDG